jgi:MoxR-like ATPase
VTPEDIKAVAVPALAHRLVLRPEMWVRQVTGEDVARQVLAQVPVPRGTPATESTATESTATGSTATGSTATGSTG